MITWAQPGPYQFSFKMNDFENKFAKIRRQPEPGRNFIEEKYGIEMIWVEGGCFEMGAGEWDGEGFEEELPVHAVEVGDFWLARFPVTQALWQAIMGSNPAKFCMGGDFPVEKVSWQDALDFIGELQKKSGHSYRLPTEAEWEYAARSGGKPEKYAGGPDLQSLAWYEGNSGASSRPVGRKQPNNLGFYDMSGNVFEWCADWFDEKYYQQAAKRNPQGPPAGVKRVIRGGSWYSSPRVARTAYRNGLAPNYRGANCGLRLALQAGPGR